MPKICAVYTHKWSTPISINIHYGIRLKKIFLTNDKYMTNHLVFKQNIFYCSST